MRWKLLFFRGKNIISNWDVTAHTRQPCRKSFLDRAVHIGQVVGSNELIDGFVMGNDFFFGQALVVWNEAN